MELLKQLNAIRDATNRSLLMNSSTDSENVPNTIPPITPSGAGDEDDVSEDDEERMFKKEEEENENEEEKKMRRRPFKYAKAMRMMMRKGGKGGAGTDDDENVDGDDREATTRITCASQNGVACAFGFANGDLLVADAETGERVALFEESSKDGDDDDGDDKNNENNKNNNNNNSITCISFDATGTFLCSSSANGTVRV
jgi:hypothetical protein